MSIAWGGGYLKSDEEIDAMWKDAAAPQREKDHSAFWLVTFFLLSGLDVVAVIYTGYRVVSWVGGYIWKVL